MSSHPDTDVSRPAAAARKQRLLYVRDTLLVCGPGKTILNTWRTIDRNRFELTIVATRPADGERNALLDAADALGAETVPLTIGRGIDLNAVKQLVTLIRKYDIDILQTHDAQTRRIGTIAALVTGVRHITSVHGWIFNDRKEKLARWIDKRLILLAHHAIAVSERLKKDLVAAGVPAARITALQNAILLDDYRSQPDRAPIRRALGICDHELTVSIIGRCSAEKGHEIFLEAARAVVTAFPAVKFLIVGDGPLRPDLERRSGELGLTDNVIFTGHRNDMAAIYGATDVLAISSFTEGIPNVLLEAFAYGKPAVATTVGGVPEVLTDGVDGWLIPPGDAAILAERLLRVLRDGAMRARMGEAGRQTIQSRFSFERRTRAVESLYR